MAQKVVIVESPAKAKTINRYLGKDYRVMSSIGHIRDLKLSGKDNLGVDVLNDFKPDYGIIKGKEKVVERLKEATKGNEVLLATDPDREGEAIAWHLAEVLELDLEDKNRIVFREITRYAVNEAIENPRKIDINLVHSQETRRILDRVIGFKLSGLLRSKINSLSAGRVQSVALKLIVDLENEINNFVPEAYFHVVAKLGKIKFDHLLNENNKIKKKEDAEKIIKNATNPFNVLNIEINEKDYYPKPAYTTATLQRDGVTLLKMNSTSIMKTAGKLYEGVSIDKKLTGLITYMRTDSVRVSPMFINLAKQYITDTYGENYVGKYGYNSSSGGGNVQDAHEAIRPTDLSLTPDYVKQFLTAEQHKLYELIFNRFISANMLPAKYEQTNIIISSNNEQFKTKAEKLLFDGYQKLTTREKRVELELPDLSVGSEIKVDKVDLEELETKPKYRYNEASLIKDLEELGIGRPSTYASIIQTLRQRHYVEVKRRFFSPTEQGVLTNNTLGQFFSHIINSEYTAKMEKELDDISLGKEDGVALLKDFYSRFEPVLEKANKELVPIVVEPEYIDKPCPLCGSKLIVRKSRYGKFIGCSTFPKCKHIEDYKEEDTK